MGGGGVRSLHGAVQTALVTQRLRAEELGVSVNPSGTVGIRLPKAVKAMEMNVGMVNPVEPD